MIWGCLSVSDRSRVPIGWDVYVAYRLILRALFYYLYFVGGVLFLLWDIIN